MKVLRKQPHKGIEEIEIPNTLKALQAEVGGYIEVFPIAADACIICNEEGKLMGLEPNCKFGGEVFVGTILITGVDGEDFTDFPLNAEEFIRMCRL